MRHRAFVLLALTALVLGCQDIPVGPPSAARDVVAVQPSLARVGANPACTKHWASAVSGFWDDNTKWSPGSVPSSTDVACIDASGTYTVTIHPANPGTPVTAKGVNIGAATGAQTLKIDGTDATLSVSMNVEIGPTGQLLFTTMNAGVVIAALMQNDGTITVTTPCPSCGAGDAIRSDVNNTGALNVDGTLTLDKVGASFTNSGAISLNGGTGIVIPAAAGSPTFAQNGGTVSAPTLALFAMEAGTYTLAGGTLSTSAATSLPVVQLKGANLVLAPTLTGTQSIAVASTAGGTNTIGGDVPSGTTISITGHGAAGNGSITWNGNPTVSGSVIMDLSAFVGTTLTLAGSGKLLNNGSIVHTLASGQSIHYALNVENRGTMNTPGATFFEKASGVFDNFGSVAMNGAAVFEVNSGATFRSQSSGTMTNGGKLKLNGAHLTGTGSVAGIITSNGSTVAPGNPIGTLSTPSFAMDATNTLTIDVNGTQPGVGFDQVVVAGQVGYGGLLNVVTGPNMGVCGQVVDVITDNSSTGRGLFNSVTGLSPGPGRNWRITLPPTHYQLIGYNASVKVDVVPPTLALGEGGPGGLYNVCVSQAPTANVVVTPAPNAQVTATPTPLTFTTANWRVPQTVSVTAIDDAVIEGPHQGSITHTVASTDAFYNGFATASVTVSITDNDGSADLALTISQAPPPLTVGLVFTVGFKVSNTGPTLSTGSTVTFQPAGGFQFQSVIGATCTGSASGLTCTVPGIASGGNAIFTLTLKAVAVGTYQKTMVVTGQQSDPSSGNNTLVRNITVN